MIFSARLRSEFEGFKICERGIRYDSNDAKGLFAGLKHLAADKGLQDKLGSNGKAFVQTNYSKARLFDDIRKLYREL